MASSECSRPREPSSAKKVSKNDFLQIIYDLLNISKFSWMFANLFSKISYLYLYCHMWPLFSCDIVVLFWIYIFFFYLNYIELFTEIQTKIVFLTHIFEINMLSSKITHPLMPICWKLCRRVYMCMIWTNNVATLKYKWMFFAIEFQNLLVTCIV